MMTPHQDRLIEPGFEAFANAQQPISPELAEDLRIAFYAGANHMFTTMVRMARSVDSRVSVAALEREFKDFTDECILRGASCAGSA
jgi:hypothetical protein